MPRKSSQGQMPGPRWMTQCDVIRYNLRMPDKLKSRIKKEAEREGMDMSSYICGVLSGDIQPPRRKKKA